MSKDTTKKPTTYAFIDSQSRLTEKFFRKEKDQDQRSVETLGCLAWSS